MFGWQEAYFGFSMEDFAKAKNALKQDDIAYKWKMFSHSRGWAGFGLPRGRTGGVVLNPKQSNHYKIYVRSADIEQARYLIRNAIRNS